MFKLCDEVLCVHFVHHPWLGCLDKKGEGEIRNRQVTIRFQAFLSRPATRIPLELSAKTMGGGGAELSAAYLRNVKSTYYKIGAWGYYLTTLWTAKN